MLGESTPPHRKGKVDSRVVGKRSRQSILLAAVLSRGNPDERVEELSRLKALLLFVGGISSLNQAVSADHLNQW